MLKELRLPNKGYKSSSKPVDVDFLEYWSCDDEAISKDDICDDDDGY
ncbi:hypothetical protein HanOQP8_Chr04g0137081 [Helianthus annuus]|nr:hypothetical protein HanOQP8_Chr04g0137081 [Helianthus annuus]KAJ0930153.1 hypothetical protein HanPSC8_Chr04g0146001 [Helianthus annuus]